MFHAQSRPAIGDDGDVQQLAGCPICLVAWPLKAAEDGWLTDEEAPPKHEWKRLGFGGKTHRCLTCVQCNNMAKFESRHAQYLEAGSATGIAYQAGQEASGMCAQHAAEHAKTAYLKASGGFEDQRRTELKSAYLIAFAALGWSYAIDPILDPIREMIRGDSTAPMPRQACFTADIDLGDRQVIAMENPIKFLLVTHPTLHDEHVGDREVHCVALPRPGGLTAEELYPTLEAVAAKGESGYYEWLTSDWDAPVSGATWG